MAKKTYFDMAKNTYNKPKLEIDYMPTKSPQLEMLMCYYEELEIQLIQSLALPSSIVEVRQGGRNVGKIINIKE